MIKNNYNKYFYLFSCCILVDGFNRSCIIDTQRKDIHFIPNSLYFILTKYKNKKIGWIKEQIQNTETIDSYYDFLINKELGIYTESLALFPPIDLNYSIPNLITNSIIEISESSDYNIDKVINDLSDLNCEVLEVRFLSHIKITELALFLDKAQHLNFRSIIIGLPHNSEYSEENIKHNILYNYPLITRIHVYGCDSFKIINSDWNEPLIIYSQQDSLEPECCGNIDPNYFALGIEMICESQLYNSCLNRKVCISKDGSIKNCPAFKESYGNIKKDSLNKIVNTELFQRMWIIKKDDIEVCKDCEMRYVCHDCRAHLKNSDNLYSKPLKCSYNPYTSTWES